MKDLARHRILVSVFIPTLIITAAWQATSSAADVVTIDSCGETVAAGCIAYLLSDLDCRGSGRGGVVLANRSRLIMGGHTIVGDPEEKSAEGRPLQGVRCEAGSICTIEGPGAVVGFSASGVAGTRVRVRDVYIAENAIAGVSAFENVRLRGVSIAQNGTMGVHAGGRVRADESDLASQSSSPIVEWRAPSLHPGCTSRD